MVGNLTQFYHDPYVFLPDRANLFLLVQCWGCTHR